MKSRSTLWLTNTEVDSQLFVEENGAGLATGVWLFCQTLKWPDPTTVAQPNDPGITWAELATSFTMASGLQLPIWHI